MCEAFGAWSGTKAASGSESTGPLNVASSTFILECGSTSPGTYASTSAAVIVYAELLTVSLSLDEDNIPFADPTELEWVTTYANECIASESSSFPTSWPDVASKATVTDQIYQETVYETGTTTPLETGTYEFRLGCTGSLGQTATGTAILRVGRNPNFSEQIGNDPNNATSTNP